MEAEKKVESPEAVVEPTVEKEPVAPKTDEEKTVDELKAEAEALEAKNKELKGEDKEGELRANYLRRLQKAREKHEALSQPEEKPQKSDDIATRDLITLSQQDIPEDSDKAKILKKYFDAGLISNYKEGLAHVGIVAEFAALDAKNNAKAVIDENADEETRLKTTKEVIRGYQASGEIPQDTKLQEKLARENLKSMGF